MAWIDAIIDPIMATHLFLPRLCWRTRWWLRWSRRLLVWRTRRWGSIPTPWGFKWMWRGDKLPKISNEYEKTQTHCPWCPCPIVLIMVGLQRKNRKTQSNKLCPILTQDNDKEVNTPCRTVHGVVLKDPLWWNNVLSVLFPLHLVLLQKRAFAVWRCWQGGAWETESQSLTQCAPRPRRGCRPTQVMAHGRCCPLIVDSIANCHTSQHWRGERFSLNVSSVYHETEIFRHRS